MKKAQNISVAKKGMIRDMAVDSLDEQAYGIAINMNMENESGELLKLKSEHSNILASKFKDGFRAIGFKTNEVKDETLFFLVNPNTGVSEIGKIKNNTQIADLNDVERECPTCNYERVLSDPLENTTQPEHQVYETYLTDDCVEANTCLGFDINYPIHTVVVKNEKLATKWFWSDGLNPPRYLDESKLAEYKVTGTIVCGVDNTQVTCIDCDKLRLFPQYQPIGITAESIEQGGSLILGSYTFFVAYADSIGQELSEYQSITQPVSIFDINNRIRDNQEAEVPTNFAIKLTVDNDSIKFSYYKIVVAVTNAVDRGTRYFDLGLFPATQTTVLFNTTKDKIESQVDEVLIPRQNILTMKGLTEANNHLLGFGITREKEWNLQPVVNLMGPFLKWQTYQATESLYEDGVLSNKFRGYLRDEVYPLGIRFITNTGYKTAVFPFIGRPAEASDTTLVVNTDQESLNQTGLNCATITRDKRWQIYNTAVFEGAWPTGAIPTNTITETVNKNSITEITETEVAEIAPGTYTFLDEIPILAITEASDDEVDTVFVSLINNAIEDGSCSGDLCDIDTSGVADVIPDYEGVCVVPTAPFDEFTLLKNIQIDNIDITYGTWPTDYSPMKVTTYCNMYVLNPADGIPLQDFDFYQEFCEFNDVDRQVYVRAYSFTNELAKSASTLIYVPPKEPIQQLYFHNYAGATQAEFNNGDLFVPNFDGLETGTGFGVSNFHINALWWVINLTNNPSGIIEVPPAFKTAGGDRIAFTNNQRISFWDTNQTDTPITPIDSVLPWDGSDVYDARNGIRYFYSYTVNQTTGNGELIILDENGFVNFIDLDYAPGSSQRLYIAIEPPINAETCGGNVEYFVRPTDYCFGVAIRDREIIEVNVDYSNIVYERVQRYSTTCDFEVPILGDCEALPYGYGKFAYWQSEETYPDNQELYDSSGLTIETSDFNGSGIAANFQSIFTTGLAGSQYVLDEGETNFRCKNVRHFKFPDNKVSPFMYAQTQSGFNPAIVYPLGVQIDDALIQDFLQIAANNGLITDEQLGSIVEYEIYRGDRTLDKGVVARGLLYDMYKYEEDNKDIWFSNFPYNDLGDNRLIYANDTRTNFIEHPGGSGRPNDKYTFHSPETEFAKPTLPTDLKVEGYQFGQSKGVFDEVEDHPKYVILGNSARQQARTLATLEVIAEAAIVAAESAEVWRVQFGIANSVNPVGISFNIAATLLSAIGAAVYKYARYKYQWEQIFRDNGDPENFASYYTSIGAYNYLQVDQAEGDWVRGIAKSSYLRDGRTVIVNEVGAEKVEINNVKREESVFISVKGNDVDYSLTHPVSYYNYDNSDVDRNSSSRTFASDSGVCKKGQSPEILRNIASPYVSLNNLLPSQYGTIDSVRWLSTSYRGDLENPSADSKLIFGGDAYIARHTLKRKAPLFLRTAMGLSDFTPINYRAYSNFGEQPAFYGNLLAPDEVTFDRNLPQIRSEYIFDCLQGFDDFYIQSPSKFYLYYYGIPSFLTETTINLNYRIGGAQPKDQFYPLFSDYVEWTQQTFVPIKEKNVYKYEGVYSSQTPRDISRTLPSTYSAAIFDTVYDSPNGAVFSRPDNNENSLTEPWLTFLPNDRYDFPTSYGQLVELKGVESEFIIGRFDRITAIFNAIDTIVDDGARPETQDLGDAFKRRPQTFFETELGYGGSQSAHSVSCELGHFWVDAKRGQVFMKGPYKGGLEEISAMVGGKPSGMRNWFKSNLPFKILAPVIENYIDINIDNPYNGVGISMGWDSRYKRIFITKKDYKPLKSLTYNVDTQKYFDGATEIQLTNTEYFEDVSWTVAFSALTGTWISYYDFHPNYYIAHNNYFQTGINLGTADEFGLWSHLLTNKSYGVFYGTKYDIVLEYPIKNTYTSKTLETIELWTSGIRYHDEYDYAYNRDISFNEMYVFNRREGSGLLKLVPQKTLRDNVNYPKTGNGFQEILMTNTNDRWNVNYIFNRVISEKNNQPITRWDGTQIRRTFNSNAISFRGKRVLEPMRGATFTVNLAYNTDSRFLVEFNWATDKEEVR